MVTRKEQVRCDADALASFPCPFLLEFHEGSLLCGSPEACHVPCPAAPFLPSPLSGAGPRALSPHHCSGSRPPGTREVRVCTGKAALRFLKGLAEGGLVGGGPRLVLANRGPSSRLAQRKIGKGPSLTFRSTRGPRHVDDTHFLSFPAGSTVPMKLSREGPRWKGLRISPAASLSFTT